MNDVIPAQELAFRWDRCRNLLHHFIPQAQGILVFSRLNIYYFSGSFASGVFWLPLSGEPVLFCRRGDERAKIDSPINHIYPFRSYSDIETILNDLGFSLPKLVAAEMNGLSWALSKSLVKHLASHQFLPADKIISMSRAQKSGWELNILRAAGSRHAKCLTTLLPTFLYEGISELEICHKISELFFSEGHLGILRMENYGEEVFLGHISVGDSANYPSVFNGPVGLRGVHPATPYMGSAEVKWTKGKPLTIDNGFTLAGYITDKTQVYWLGDKENMPVNAIKAHTKTAISKDTYSNTLPFVPSPQGRGVRQVPSPLVGEGKGEGACSLTYALLSNFCIDLQDQIVEFLRPGTLPSESWNHCLAKVERSEWSSGFMGLGKNKVFFVGHGIGLAIDEYPALAKGFDLSLEEGMTLAVEPKIGIPGFGMVGVENTFEVTTDGGKCLTGETFDIISI
ncbi:MAG: M24 family metallopeptidase [Thermodesulfovibrionales bacterium]|nr:M24 family metallopeptidase [Thermodesulfovibrionales bacterium]